MSVFSEPEDFEAALRKEGCLGLLITGRDQFRARLTQVALNRLHLSAGEEQVSRVSFVKVPADSILMLFPIGTASSPIWGGIGMRAGEIMMVGPGQRVHARTDGLCRWGAIRMPVEELIRYGRAVTGATVTIPLVARCWRPPTAVGRCLRQLHAAAIRMAQTRPQLLVDAKAAHGLEQQLIHGLVECLPADSEDEGILAAHRHQDIIGRFEDLVQSRPERNLRMAEICAVLGVSGWLLRSLCTEHLGMSPTGYVRLRRMSLVRRALGREDNRGTSVSEIARRHGFHDGGRFAASYSALFGELPSATLARSFHPEMARRRRPRPPAGI